MQLYPSKYCRKLWPQQRYRFSPVSRCLGSASELEYYLLLANDLRFLDEADYQRLSGETQEVKQMLTAFIKKLKADG